jgi:hypothetical protein
MRTSLLFLVVALSGCGGAAHYKHELLGTGPMPIAASPDVPAPSPPPVDVVAGEHVLVSWTIAQPMAEEIGYRIDCGGASATGALGESMERYRERRVAQLRAQREEQRAAAAKQAEEQAAEREAAEQQAATQPARDRRSPRRGSGQGRVVVRTPAGQGGVDISIDAAVVTSSGPSAAQLAAARQAEYDAALDAGVLPPGDVGAGTLSGSRAFDIDRDGRCAMVVFSPTHDLRGTFKIERVRDLRAEAAVIAGARADAAIEVRTELMGTLVAGGADPTLQPRRRAEAQLALELEVRRRRALELQRRELEARRLQRALDLRVQLTAQLVAGGADPDFRARQQRQADQRRAQAAADRAARLQVRADADAERDRARAARLQLRLDAAFAVRGRLMSGLMAQGARPRPPRPADLIEDPGAAPIEGMAWMPGAWSWSSGQWVWSAGGWVDARGGFVAAGTAGGGPTTTSTSTSTSSSVGAALGAAASVLGGLSASGTVTITPAPTPAPGDKPKDKDKPKGKVTTVDHRQSP